LGKHSTTLSCREESPTLQAKKQYRDERKQAKPRTVRNRGSSQTTTGGAATGEVQKAEEEEEIW
jgi:hypothetical protein